MEKKEKFDKEWQDKEREKMVKVQFPKTIKRIEDKAREEGLKDGIELEMLRNAEFFEEDYQNPKRLRELKKKYNFKEDK